MRVIKAVEDVNEEQKSVLFEKLKRYFNNDLNGKLIAIWGLSFKPQTDDMREAPALILIDKLLQAGCHIKAYDPEAINEAKRIIGDKIIYANDKEEALIDADCLLLVTEWNSFRMLNYNVMSKLMKQKVVFDGRNIYDAKEMYENGFDYFCIGITTK